MKKKTSKFQILLLLTTMFAAPGLAAYLFYTHPQWLNSTSTINKGSLLNPPTVLKSLDTAKKWRIVYWSPKSCGKVCLKHLDTVARSRLALGRKLYDVDQWLILGSHAKPLSPELLAQFKDQDFHTAQLSEGDQDSMSVLPPHSRVYLANPESYLILSYESRFNPNDVYKDLKILLNHEPKRG
ncbi:MAG: hypothetical protein EPN84_02050 [Legionella sp.]|nr:MAG: hypothetical protein EPN84_02050 [Legionella sp.]